jgi:O-antigen/teichoic acid export membrane protein
MNGQKQPDNQTILSSQRLMDAQNKKNIIWNAIGISSNSFYAMIVMIIVTRVNGLEVMGGFFYAFYVASIFHTIGVYGGRIYHISDAKGEFTNSNYVSLKFVTILFMFVGAFLFSLLSGDSWERILLIFIFLLYRALESIGDAYLGIMERNYRLDLKGKSMALKTLIGVAVFTIINLWTMNVYIAGLAFVLSFGLVLLFFDIPIVTRFDKIVIGFGDSIIKLLKRCFSIFIFAFFTLLILNVTRIVVAGVLDDGLLGIYNILVMPAAVMVLFSQLIFQPFMMELTFALHNKDYKRFSKRVKKLFLLLIAGGTIIIIVALLIGIPVLSFIYGVDLTGYRWPLAWMIFAGVAGGGSAVASWLLTLMRQFKSQIILFMITFIVGVITSVLLVHARGLEGAFIGFTLTYTVQLTLFLLAYNVTYRRHRKIQ